MVQLVFDATLHPLDPPTGNRPDQDHQDHQDYPDHPGNLDQSNSPVATTAYLADHITADDVKEHGIELQEEELEPMDRRPVEEAVTYRNLGEVIAKAGIELKEAVYESYIDFVTKDRLDAALRAVLEDAAYNAGENLPELARQYRELTTKADVQWRTFCAAREHFILLYKTISSELNEIYAHAKSSNPNKVLKQALGPAPGGLAGDLPRIVVTPYIAQLTGVKTARRELVKGSDKEETVKQAGPEELASCVKPGDFDTPEELELAKALGVYRGD